MKRGTPEHPKTTFLAQDLKVARWGAVGLLELLWHATAKHHPDGNIGRWSNAMIARAVYWGGDPDRLVGALIRAGYLGEVPPPYRLAVHDWLSHCDWAVRKRLKEMAKFEERRDGSQQVAKGRDFLDPPEPEPEPEPNRVARRTRIPGDFTWTDERKALAVKHKVREPAVEFAGFVAHFEANGLVMLDWDKAWLKWCLNSHKFAGRNGNGTPRFTGHTQVIPSVEETRRMMREKGLA